LKQDDRYLTKVERFIKEEEFILTHTIENDALSKIGDLKTIILKVIEY
jgi:hypothetical protein